MANEGNQRKPVNTPNGWGLRNKFIDSEGYEFSKGKFTGKQYEKDSEGRWSNPVEVFDDEPPSQPDKAEPKETKPDTGGELGITNELLDKIREMEAKMEKQREEFMSSLRSRPGGSSIDPEDLANAMVKAQQYQKGGSYYTDIRDIDPDDFMKVPAVFTSYGTGYVIVDDKRNGRPVRTPYGNLIKFKFSASRITRVGRTEQYSSFCSYTTHSKKEAEWLRNHTKYKIEFFEDEKLALNADVFYIRIASDVARHVHNMEQNQILARAHDMGIPVGGDLADIISKIIHIETERRMKEEQQRMENRAITVLEQSNDVRNPAPGIIT